MKSVNTNRRIVLLNVILWLSLLLVACGDPTATNKPVITPTAQPVITSTPPASPPTRAIPTNTAVATSPTATSAPTIAPTNAATATVIPPIAPTAEVESTPLATISIPKLDASTEGVILYEYNCDIWVMTLPEARRSQLTNDGADNCKTRQFFNRFPVWSPDSLQIAFASVRDVLQDPDHKIGYEVYTMRPDGSNLKRVTQTHGSLSKGNSPLMWLPTGDILVENNDKPLLDPASGQFKELPASYKVGAFAISPDKAFIAYSTSKRVFNLTATPNSQRDNYEDSLYIVTLNGGTPKLLITTPVNNPMSKFAWSPDGKTIAYFQWLSLGECGSYGIYTINKDGGTPKKLYEVGTYEYTPPQVLSFAPNGKWLTYSLSKCGGGNTKIFLVDTEKGGPPIELGFGLNPSYGRKIGG